MMHNTLRIDPYKPKSASAKALSLRTGILRATPKQVRKYGTFNTVINWGSSERRFPNARYINDPTAVAIASNKLSSARELDSGGISQPAFTTSREQACEWYREGATVVGRGLLCASRGRGIHLYTNDEQYDSEMGGRSITHSLGSTRDPLYTKYVKKSREFRVHIFGGRVIDVQEKRKRQEVPNDQVNYFIRNNSNGWVFCRDSVDCPDSILDLSIRAVSVLGLDFGAADVGWNDHYGRGYIFEVNTAPGLEGTTLDKYYEAISGALPQIKGGPYRRRRVA